MSESLSKPENMGWLTPMLTVADAARALAFYEAAFGFTRGDVMTDELGVVTHADVSYRDVRVMFAPADTSHPSPARPPVESGQTPPVLLYVYCDDVDALFDRARAAGAGVLAAPADLPWGDRMCSLTDPDGHIWNFATHKGFGAAKTEGSGGGAW